MRQEQQQRFLQQPGMIPAGMQNYQNMLRMQQAGGMPMNSNELRQRASLNNNRNVYVPATRKRHPNPSASRFIYDHVKNGFLG